MGAIYIMGDVHGQYGKLTRILQSAGLLGAGLGWTGDDAQLWFIGDFFDRGPDGVVTVDLVMRLQAEASAAGGRVEALLGNHEPLILGAYRFPRRNSGGPGGTFLSDWEMNGGSRSDLERLKPEHVAWLTSRPALALVGQDLLIHADATFYHRYGESIAQVNQAMAALLRSDDAVAWDRLLGDFAERNAFDEGCPEGRERAERLLRTFGGRRIIHGHTPIAYMTHWRPEQVTEPYIYANGLCVNVDGGMYRGGPGFIYQVQ